jgi:hypothetical protein
MSQEAGSSSKAFAVTLQQRLVECKCALAGEVRSEAGTLSEAESKGDRMCAAASFRLPCSYAEPSGLKRIWRNAPREPIPITIPTRMPTPNKEQTIAWKCASDLIMERQRGRVKRKASTRPCRRTHRGGRRRSSGRQAPGIFGLPCGLCAWPSGSCRPGKSRAR